MGSNPFRSSQLAKCKSELAGLKTDYRKLESRNHDFVLTIARLNEEVLQLKAMLEAVVDEQRSRFTNVGRKKEGVNKSSGEEGYDGAAESDE